MFPTPYPAPATFMRRRSVRAVIFGVLLALAAPMLAPALPAAASATRVLGDRVSYADGSAAPGVKVVLYTATPAGQRQDFLGSTYTGALGYYAFDVVDGCYTTVFVAPEDHSFSPSAADPFDERFGCLSGADRKDFDTTIFHDAAPAPGSPINGRIRFADGSGAVDIKVALWSATPSGQRQEFLGSAFTDTSGDFAFERGDGCYALVIEAPSGSSWAADTAVRWKEFAGCLPGTALGGLTPVLHVGDVIIGDKVATSAADPVTGLRVDLHAATESGTKQGWLKAATTSASGNYGFSVANGCYTVVFAAKAGMSYAVGSQKNTLERHICTNGRDQKDIDAVGYVTVATPTQPSCFTRVFRDDFNTPGAPGPGWTMFNGPGNRNFGLRDPKQASVSNGKLHLTAEMKDGVLRSAGMRQNIEQAYGYFEVRVRVDADQSAATSGVVLTWPESQNWPYDGENNIFETAMVDENGEAAGRPDRMPTKSFVHYAQGTTHKQVERIHPGSDGKQWATYAMEWTPEGVTFFRNGVATQTVTDPAAIPDAPHHLTVQLDAFRHTMDGVVRMQVDWVEIKRYTC